MHSPLVVSVVSGGPLHMQLGENDISHGLCPTLSMRSARQVQSRNGCQQNVVGAPGQHTKPLPYIPSFTKNLQQRLRRRKAFFPHSSIFTIVFVPNLVLVSVGTRSCVRSRLPLPLPLLLPFPLPLLHVLALALSLSLCLPLVGEGTICF